MSIKLVMPSNHFILCCPLLLLPSIFPSIRVFSNESVLCIRQPKYWSFSFSISTSSEHPGLICFKMDWLDLLMVQEILKSLLQHHSSKAKILSVLSFLYSQLSHIQAIQMLPFLGVSNILAQRSLIPPSLPALKRSALLLNTDPTPTVTISRLRKNFTLKRLSSLGQSQIV